MQNIPKWQLDGDWFDVCKCNIPCPCEFARTPTFGDCDAILAWRVRKGAYGDIALDGLNVLGLIYFQGNIWAGNTKASFAMFLDARASDVQRDALETVFSGKAGGWPGQFAQLIAEVRGVEVAPIEIEIDGDLATWRATIAGKAEARAEALSGPTSTPGKRVQTINSPGCEVGPGPNIVATWGTAVTDRANAFGFQWSRSGQSSKLIPFSWQGPD